MRPGTLLFFPAKVRYIVLAAYRVVRYAREAAAAEAAAGQARPDCSSEQLASAAQRPKSAGRRQPANPHVRLTC